MPWGFAVAAGVGAIGSVVAGGEQAQGAEAAANTQAGMFNTIVGQEQPFMQAGVGATTGLNKLLGTAPGSFNGLPNGYLTEQFNPTQSQLENYPGYQFQLGQGEQAINNASSPGVGAVSGPALKQLMGYGQGLASSNYQNYFNQFQTQQNNIFSRLSGIAGLGQNAASNTGTAGTALGQGIGQAQYAAGSATAGGIVGATNAVGNNSLSYLLAANNQGGSGLSGNPNATFAPSSGSWSADGSTWTPSS